MKFDVTRTLVKSQMNSCFSNTAELKYSYKVMNASYRIVTGTHFIAKVLWYDCKPNNQWQHRTTMCRIAEITLSLTDVLFLWWQVFAQSVGEGIISSMVLFFIPYGAFHDAVRPDGTDMAGHQAFGVAVASILLVAVTLRVRRITGCCSPIQA